MQDKIKAYFLPNKIEFRTSKDTEWLVSDNSVNLGDWE